MKYAPLTFIFIKLGIVLMSRKPRSINAFGGLLKIKEKIMLEKTWVESRVEIGSAFFLVPTLIYSSATIFSSAKFNLF